MNLTTVLARGSRAFAFAVTLQFVAGMMFAQDTPVASPPLTMKPGTVLTVRINEPLSSDHNQVGDVFSATLMQPIIVLGIVVARYGQTAAGRVVEAKRAGRVSGVSRLGIMLTSLTLVDGQTVPIQSHLLVREGPTSLGRDAAAVAGTTGLGAVIGAAADWSKGAAIGAAAGAAVSTIGVLLTRGDPTVVEPEALLTFQVTAPVLIETNDAPEAFRFVNSADYPPEQSQPRQAPAYPYSPYVYYALFQYPFYYPYYGYPYVYGTSLSFFFGYPAYYHHYGYYGYPGHYGHVYHGGMAHH